MLKECQSKNLYIAKNPSKIEVDIKIFSDEEKLKEFFFSRLALLKKKKTPREFSLG